MKRQSIGTLLKQYEALVEQLVTIAEGAQTTAATLRKLSHVTDGWITTCVSLNPNTPSDVLEKQLKSAPGADGTDVETRIHIAGNPALREKIVRAILVNDPSLDVRGAALLALAKRVTTRTDVTASQLWGLYGCALKFEMHSVKRASGIKNVLLRHPRFPHGKLKKKK